MKYMIFVILSLMGVTMLSGMGTAVQQIYKAPRQDRSSLSRHHDADESSIWTGLGLATVDALKSLCVCQTRSVHKKRHKSFGGAKEE